MMRLSNNFSLNVNVVSRIVDTGSKGCPLFRFGTWREEGYETPSPGVPRQVLPIDVQASNTGTQGVYPGSGRPEANMPTPACLD